MCYPASCPTYSRILLNSRGAAQVTKGHSGWDRYFDGETPYPEQQAKPTDYSGYGVPALSRLAPCVGFEAAKYAELELELCRVHSHAWFHSRRLPGRLDGAEGADRQVGGRATSVIPLFSELISARLDFSVLPVLCRGNAARF